jgi:hypothetical protein
MKVFAMNILHGLLREPSIVQEINHLLSHIAVVVIKGFASESWHFRNACTVAFGTVFQRIFGSKKVRDEDESVSRMSSRDFAFRLELVNAKAHIQGFLNYCHCFWKSSTALRPSQQL